MNKFILIPKDQYDKFKDLQDNKDSFPTNGKHTTDHKFTDNVSDESFKANNTPQMKESVKPVESVNRELPPPPGLPEQYIKTSDVKSQSHIPDISTSGGANHRGIKQVGNGATAKESRRRSEWFKFWNKNIR